MSSLSCSWDLSGYDFLLVQESFAIHFQYPPLQEMATPLGTTFSTDEQVVAQGDVSFMGKMVESLIVKFDQAKYEKFISSDSKSLRVTRQYRGVSSEVRPQVSSETSQRWPT